MNQHSVPSTTVSLLLASIGTVKTNEPESTQGREATSSTEYDTCRSVPNRYCSQERTALTRRLPKVPACVGQAEVLGVQMHQSHLLDSCLARRPPTTTPLPGFATPRHARTSSCCEIKSGASGMYPAVTYGEYISQWLLLCPSRRSAEYPAPSEHLRPERMRTRHTHITHTHSTTRDGSGTFSRWWWATQTQPAFVDRPKMNQLSVVRARLYLRFRSTSHTTSLPLFALHPRTMRL